MKQKLTLFTSVCILTTLSGCSISTTVKPVETQISKLCIKKNPKVFMDGFLPELQAQIEQHNISTTIIDELSKSECANNLEYTANWAWDLAMYLTYAELRVYENATLIGKATYDARWGAARLDKFGSTAGKLKTLTDPLFNLNKQGAFSEATNKTVIKEPMPYYEKTPVINQSVKVPQPTYEKMPVTQKVTEDFVIYDGNNEKVQSGQSAGDLRDCLKLQTNEAVIKCTESGR